MRDTKLETVMGRAIEGDADAAAQFADSARALLDSAKGRKLTPIQESWTEGRHVSGTVTFQWLKDDPIPAKAQQLYELHMGDVVIDGELENVGRCRFRVNSFKFWIDEDRGMRSAEAGIEVLP